MKFIMERMRGILNQNEFDEELVHELIKRIYVGMDNSVEVEFKCSDPYQEVLAIMSEVQNQIPLNPDWKDVAQIVEK